jgi:hypothetical protein
MDTNGIEKTGIEAIVLRPQTFGEEYTIRNHQKYRQEENKYLEYDITRIKTAKPIEFVIKDNAFTVNSICLPKAEHFGESIITGWASIKPNYTDSLTGQRPDKLQKGQLKSVFQ